MPRARRLPVVRKTRSLGFLRKRAPSPAKPTEIHEVMFCFARLCAHHDIDPKTLLSLNVTLDEPLGIICEVTAGRVDTFCCGDPPIALGKLAKKLDYGRKDWKDICDGSAASSKSGDGRTGERSVPTDEALALSIGLIRLLEKGMSKAALMERLNMMHNWHIGNHTLDRVMKEKGLFALDNTRVVHHARGVGVADPGPPPIPKRYKGLGIPADALEAQNRFYNGIGSSNRQIFKIYGSGEYDWGVCVSKVMCLILPHVTSLVITYAVGYNRPSPDDPRTKAMANSWPVLLLWSYYKAAAQGAGVAEADIACQYEPEYRLDPRPYVPDTISAPKRTPPGLFLDLMAHYVFRFLYAHPENEDVFLNEDGEFEWDGRYEDMRVTVVTLDKKTGDTVGKRSRGKVLR